MPLPKNNNSLLWKYAGLTTQLFIALGSAVFIGIKTDKWLQIKSPIMVWIFPLIIISAIIYKVIKDTAPKK